MKTFISVLSLMAGSSDAQDLNNSSTRKNTISIETYAPITTSGLRHLFNENWILNSSPYFDGINKRNYSAIGFGLSHERIIKSDIVLRTRIGFSMRKVTEEVSFSGGFNEFETTTSKESFDYHQNHVNLFLGIAKKLKITDNLNIDAGIELPFIAYLDSESQYRSEVRNQELVGEENYYNYKATVDISYGTAYLMGAGPLIKLEYLFSNNISISAETQFYFMYTMVDDILDYHEVSEQESSWEPEPYLIDEHVQTEFELSQWNWSKISPLFRIGYRF